MSHEGDSSPLPPAIECYRRSLSQKRASSRTPDILDQTIPFGVHSIQNKRPEMEDAHRAVLAQRADSSYGSTAGIPRTPQSERAKAESLAGVSFFAVFDGHAGVKAAEFAAEHLFSHVAANAALLPNNATEALRKAFLQTEDTFITLALEQEWMDGTTAAVALVDRPNNTIIAGNVGDSEIVLCSLPASGQLEVKLLTEIHQLKRNSAEAERISGLGGRVWKGRLGHTKINPMVLSLAVSRSIGDMYFKCQKYTGEKTTGLTADPYISTAKLNEGHPLLEFLIIGCDGLWDAVKYQEAADFVLANLREGLDPQGISESLVKLASDRGSSDNITVMLAVVSGSLDAVADPFPFAS